MRWHRSWRADPAARIIADRHYNRQKVGSPQFVPPGSCLVLITCDASALWITSWPIAKYVKHQWAGAWVNSCFRNESGGRLLSSELILEAVAATRAFYGEAPELGMVSFVDETKIRHKRDPGRCFIKAGFEYVGRTKEDNLLAFQMQPEKMPLPLPALDYRNGIGPKSRRRVASS